MQRNEGISLYFSRPTGYKSRFLAVQSKLGQGLEGRPRHVTTSKSDPFNERGCKPRRLILQYSNIAMGNLRTKRKFLAGKKKALNMGFCDFAANHVGSQGIAMALGSSSPSLVALVWASLGCHLPNGGYRRQSSRVFTEELWHLNTWTSCVLMVSLKIQRNWPDRSGNHLLRMI